MPETRYSRLYGYPPELTAERKVLANAIITQLPYEFSDEQLADEAEGKALEKANQLIDAISNLAEAKVFLKRLCGRLIKKGLLP